MHRIPSLFFTSMSVGALESLQNGADTSFGAAGRCFLGWASDNLGLFLLSNVAVTALQSSREPGSEIMHQVVSRSHLCAIL